MIDFHIHLAPGLEARAAEPRTRYAYGIPVQTEHALLGDVDALLRTVEAGGVDLAVLSSGRGIDGTLEHARTANEGLARVVEQHPDQLRFMAHVPSPACAGYLDEVVRWLHSCPGAAVPSGYAGVALDDPRLEDLYSLLERSGKFLWIHPALGPGEQEAQVYDAYDLYRTVGREFALLLGALRLILGGTLDRHPQLKVVVSHLGGALAGLVPRIQHYQDKVMFGLVEDPVHGRTPASSIDAYLRRMYFDTAGHFGDPMAIQVALCQIEPARMVLGTDYPQEIRNPAAIREFVADLRRGGMALDGAGLVV